MVINGVFVFEVEAESLSSCVHAHSLQVCLALPPQWSRPTRLLCPWGFSGQECFGESPCPPQRSSTQGLQAMSPVLQVVILATESHQGSLSLLTWSQRLFQLARVGSWPCTIDAHIIHFAGEECSVGWPLCGCNYSAVIWNLANNQGVCKKAGI